MFHATIFRPLKVFKYSNKICFTYFSSSKRAFPSPIVEAHASRVESLCVENCSISRSPPSKVSATSSLLNSWRSSVSHAVS